jgi:hypothetical protein
VLGCTAGRHGVDGIAWYPRRPSIDSGAVRGGAAAPVQQVLEVWAAATDVVGCAYPC